LAVPTSSSLVQQNVIVIAIFAPLALQVADRFPPSTAA